MLYEAGDHLQYRNKCAGVELCETMGLCNRGPTDVCLIFSISKFRSSKRRWLGRIPSHWREVSRLPVLWDHSLARYSVRTTYAKRRMRSPREWIAHSTSTSSATLWQFPITSPTTDGRPS